MTRRAPLVHWLGLCAVGFGVMGIMVNRGAAGEPVPDPLSGARKSVPATGAMGVIKVPLDEIPSDCRASICRVVGQPTLSATGMPEEFVGPAGLYEWLLQHPDRAAQAWRRLGAPCLEITDRGQGVFGCVDPHGSDIHWQTVYQTPEMRVWYAEGRARPSLLLPPMVVHAVAVLQCEVVPEAKGKTHVKQQAHLYLHTDSKTANLLLRLIGPTAPRLTEECVRQLQLFYSTLVRYAERHPDQAEWLLFGTKPEPTSPTPRPATARKEG